MNVNLEEPIEIVLDSAKLVYEHEGSGVIEFKILDQPVRLNICKKKYIYDINLEIDDRVKLLEDYSCFKKGTEGILKKIIVDKTRDRADILFDKVLPDQIIKPIDEGHVIEKSISIYFQVPLDIIEKL